MKKSFIISMLLLSVLALGSGCAQEAINADSIQAKQTEIALSEAQRQIGMPNIVNFQQRKLMKTIYELCDKEDLVTYAYIKSDYQGKLFLSENASDTAFLFQLNSQIQKW